MGIFSIFSRKKPEPETTAPISAPERIHYADVPAWLDSVLSDGLGGLEGKASEACAGILSKRDRLNERIEALGRESFDPQDKTYAKVNMAKDTFVKKSLAALNGIKRPGDLKDYETLSRFRDGVLSALDSMKRASPKQAILISNYFKKRSAEMVADMKGLDAAAAGLTRLLEGDGRLLKAVKDAKHCVAKLAELETGRRVDDINLSKASVLESAVGNRITTKQSELDSLMNSDEWKLYAESLEKLAGIEARIKSIEQDANNMLSVLRRPMKKLSHEKDIAGLPENPFREVVLSGGSIEGMVNAVMEAASAGEIALKPSEREKIIALGDSSLAELKDSYDMASDERRRLEGSINAALLERKKLTEGTIDGLKSDKQRIRKEIEFLEERVRRNNDERQRRLEETSRAVQEAVGKEVTIALQKDAGQA